METGAKLPAAARRLGELQGWRRLAVAALAGVALATVQAPLGFYPVFLLALPILFWQLGAEGDARSAAWLGWAAGVGYFAAGLHWIVEPFLVDPIRHGWMAPFALIGLAGGLALFWALAFGLARILAGGLLLAPALAVTLTTVELSRAYILTGFPWNLLAYGWIESPIAQTAALIGPHALGGVTVLVAGLMALGWRGWPVWTAVGVTVVGWAYGTMVIPDVAPDRETPVTVRLVQPNATQDTKWTDAGLRAQYIRALEATAAPGEYDVAIWPEAAVPIYTSEPARRWGSTIYAWADISTVAQGRTSIIGARNRTSERTTRFFNSLAVVQGGQVRQSYDKHHLVPFGEYIPLADILPSLGLTGLASTLSDLGGRTSPGPGPTTMTIDGLPPFTPLICYEAIFPHEIRPNGQRAEWLVHITNDAWFGELVGPYQHLAQARFRAIEQGLPVARSANTGVSAMIDPWGRVTASVELGIDGFVDANLPAPAPDTLYGQTGDAPLAIILLITVIALIGATIRRRFAG